MVSRERIVVGDTEAEAAGVVPGMRLSGAWALLPTLQVQPRDLDCEAAARQRLACRLGEFSPEICLRGEQSILIEIAASLRLFGGLEALRGKMLAAVSAQGFSLHSALAPTPLGALWLAEAAPNTRCIDTASLRTAIAALPIAILDLPARELARLSAFGTTTLGEVLRLPQAGLARRLGTGVVSQLARALGEVPDPLPRFVFPERFAQRLELPGRVEHAQALAFAGRRLLEAMVGWLAAHQAGILACTLLLEHERGTQARPPTTLILGFSNLSRDLERMTRVLGERLHSLQLPAAVEALQLIANDPQPLAGRAASLFAGGSAATPGERNEAIAALVERLQARLGAAAVHGLRLHAEHRPELASQPCPVLPAPPHTPTPNGPRPLWLLPKVQPITERDGRPQRGGPLQLLAGPERIESGWWDEDESTDKTAALGDVRRDYFIAHAPGGEWLWVFRNTEGWFLHGVFA